MSLRVLQWIGALILFALICPYARAQIVGTTIPYQQTIRSGDRLSPSPAQQAYRRSSVTQSYLSSDAALVICNATTVTGSTVSQSVSLTNATAKISFTGASATFLSATKTFKLFDATNTGGLSITLDGSNNPSLASSGGTVTAQNRFIASNSVQISNTTGRLQFAGDELITSTTKNFRFWDDANTGGVTMTLDASYNGGLSTSGQNLTYQYGDFIVSNAASPGNSFRVTDGSVNANMYTQCWSDQSGICTIGWNWRYIGNTSPSFQLPNAAKSGYVIKSNQNGANDALEINYVTGTTNADIHSAMKLDTTTASPFWTVSIPWTGPYNWRQAFTSGSGTVTIPSWVSRVYITVVGGGGGGANTNFAGGGGGGCILNMPLVTVSTFTSTISYVVGAGTATASQAPGGDSSVTYNGFVYTATGGGAGVATTGGTGGNAVLGSQTLATGGIGTANAAGAAGGRGDPYFFGGGGGGGGSQAGGQSGYMQANPGGAASGTGGSSCLGVGGAGGAASGYGAGGSNSVASLGGFVELYGIGGI